VALAFAADLLCPAAGPAGACGACAECREAAAGAHPDLFLAAPEGASRSLPIERIRELIAWTGARAFRRGRKVAVLRDAERMTEEAQNALLKTLEEPPPGTVLLLVSSRPAKLLETVRSRCRLVRFRPLGREETQSVLERRPEVPPGESAALAVLSGGSPGRALELVGPEGGEDRAAIEAALRGARAPEELVADLFGEERAPEEGGARARARLRRMATLGAALLREVVLARAGARTAGLADESALADLERRHPGDEAEAALARLLRAAQQAEGPLSPSLLLAEALGSR
jgi:DNA polymerase-3 subunit delta'